MNYTIEYDVVHGAYMACFENGDVILLGAETMEEAYAEVNSMETI